MGMPPVCLDSLTIENALNNVLLSVALGEAAVAHIINAQGEILQAIADPSGPFTGPTIQCGDIFAEYVPSLAEMFECLQTLECSMVKKLMIAEEVTAICEPCV